MKWIQTVIFVAATIVTIQSGANPAVISVRGHEELAERTCNGKCSMIPTSTVEFANGNTFVRFGESVAGLAVTIPIGASLTADQFIEVLIKIRTAKQDFASSVNVQTSNGLKSVAVLDSAKSGRIFSTELAMKMIRLAGADSMNNVNFATPRQPYTSFRTSENKYVVDAGSHPELAAKLALELDLPLRKASEAVAYAEKNPNAHALVVATVVAPQNENLLKSLALTSRLKGFGQSITYVTPYLPYARTDKKDQAGVTVTGRLAAEMIEIAGADAVEFVRAHAPQSEGFFRVPTVQTMGKKTITEYLRGEGVEQIISPDAGFQKDATLYAEMLNLPVGVVNKQRDPITGESKLHDMSGPSVRGKRVAIIDDETASGSTLHQVAELLKKQGAKVVLGVVTHLAGDGKKAIDSPFLDKLVVTDTIPVKVRSERLTVLSVSDEISSDLRRQLGIKLICRKVMGN